MDRMPGGSNQSGVGYNSPPGGLGCGGGSRGIVGSLIHAIHVPTSLRCQCVITKLPC